MPNTVENQKIVIVIKEISDSKHPYSIINLAAIDEAMKVLKNSEFKLWLYIAKNQNNYKFALSCVDFCRCANVSKNTYHTAVNALIEKGYLMPKEDNSNTYTFYEGSINYKTKEDIEIDFPQEKTDEIREFKF